MSNHSDQYRPHGFIKKYLVTKADGTPVDPDAEYFVLRLDSGGKDDVHVAACRAAILLYADCVEQHLPALAADIRNRYGTASVQASAEGGRCPECNRLDQEDTVLRLRAEVRRLEHDLDTSTNEFTSALAERDHEIDKAREAMDSGADDARWKPGQSAVDALIAERDRLAAAVKHLRGKIQLALDTLNKIDHYIPTDPFGEDRTDIYNMVLNVEEQLAAEVSKEKL